MGAFKNIENHIRKQPDWLGRTNIYSAVDRLATATNTEILIALLLKFQWCQPCHHFVNNLRVNYYNT